ncbi:MAG: glycoside hydrolase family 6 protein [Solirubrobacteraceae bacterium]
MAGLGKLIPAAVIVAVFALAPAAANADLPDPLGFHLSSAVIMPEDVGNAVVTIERTVTLREAQIRYTTLPGTVVRYQDYTPVKSMIVFMPGQASATFSIPIVNHGMVELPKTIRIALFGAHPTGMGAPSTAVLTIVSGAVSVLARDPLNPLGLAATPPSRDPLTGATPFVDRQAGLAAAQARRWRQSRPRAAAMLNVIAGQPEVHRWGNWSGPDPGVQVSQFMVRTQAQEPGTVPEFATYWIVDSKRIHQRCHPYSDPPWRQRAYHNWVQSLARGVGNYRAIMFEEMDSLITVGCLSRTGLAVREHELADANAILSSVPHLVVYQDAGAADAVHARPMARLLLASGVSKIQGFYLNSTHFDWTLKEIKSGEQISRLTGGKHFVVNTAENGQGPLVPRNRVKYGNELLCNPPNRGLGPKPTFATGFPKVDAFAWIANPGKSGGFCRPGAPPTGDFWPALALELVRHANFRVR